MKLITNGFPKSGNHALAKACELLGVPCRVNHITYKEGLPEGTTHHILIKRDPRNVIPSWLRHKGMQVTPGMFLSAFQEFSEKSLASEMGEYLKWTKDPKTLVVKYESLVKNSREMKRIAKYLGVPYLKGAFEDLPGYTVTWHKEHSDYQNIWTPEVSDFWEANGGPKLLKQWKY